MQAASNAYKELMRRKWRNPLSYVRVTIGLINQQAQASGYIPETENYTYFSNLIRPMDNYQVTELYATCEQDYTPTDGSVYFLPRNVSDVVLNQGIVTEELLGTIEIRFPVAYDIKGLTIEFGKAYPVDFKIESDHNTVEITGNRNGHFITEEIFDGATFLRFTPSNLVNGQGRFRIQTITMGIGIYFDNRKIKSATKKEYISPITEELPTIDFDLTVSNQDRAFDIENEESTVNFLEVGQKIEVLYGQALDDGSIEWMPGTVLYLKEWGADDEEMDFSATDRFDGMDGTYYRGRYEKDGVSLYELAVDVLEDAGIDPREYWIDPYLKDVMIHNPVPAVSHKEALQLIANAGRCILYQDRSGNIFLKSSFIPEMTPSSDNETYFSHAGNVLDQAGRMSYGLASRDYADVRPSQYFLPREQEGKEYLDTGYVSEAVAGEDGNFSKNPTLTITLEAAFKCFGLTLEFGRNHPESMIFHAYYNGELTEDYEVNGLTEITVISHEFPEFDCLILEFTRGQPNNRVVLNRITFGDSTDYSLEYGNELTKTPKGTQLAKVRELQVVRTLYGPSSEEAMELVKEIVNVTEENSWHTFYFSNASYELAAAITNPQEGQSVKIVENSNYYATVELTGVSGEVEVAISGKEYVVTKSKVSRQLNTTGSMETWENPLVSGISHGNDLAEWIGDYMRADREYDLSYRGEPRIDANDIAFLENKYVPDLLIRIYEHTLKFNGAFSGTIKARRDMSNVAAAKNRLEG